jgi:hypothetical protein
VIRTFLEKVNPSGVKLMAFPPGELLSGMNGADLFSWMTIGVEVVREKWLREFGQVYK